MHFQQGPYLRIKSPITTDGANILIVGDRVQYKETHLPMSAKKYMEAQNAKLPGNLKKIIEVVGGEEKRGPGRPPKTE